MHFGAAPARDVSRDRLALGCTCGLHLLAALLWMQQRPTAPAPDPARQRAFLVELVTPAVPAPLPAPPPATPAPGRRVAPAAAARPVPARPPTPQAEAEPAPAPPPAGNPSDEPAPAADTPASIEPGFTLGLARKQAGRIDRELRKGKPGVPAEADTPWGRFQRGVERAYVDRSMTLLIDTYTAPDGVIIYRFRQGNSVRCTRSGSVGVLPSSMGEAGTAGSVNCPKGVSWKPG